MNEKTKITVVGLGYVGMSLAVLLGRTQDVVALDIDPARVAMVNSGRPTVIDTDVEEVMANETLSLVATTDPIESRRFDFAVLRFNMRLTVRALQKSRRWAKAKADAGPMHPLTVPQPIALQKIILSETHSNCLQLVFCGCADIALGSTQQFEASL
jgi:hypothetical protein